MFLLFSLSLILTGCRRRSTDNPQKETDTIISADSIVPQISNDTLIEEFIPEEELFDIYGDTVWINPYGSQRWFDTITGENYEAILTVEVDTTDFIVDTVRSVKGNRIVIGYNHNYKLSFNKNNNHWFSLSFDKKNDLKNILRNTDYWLESNLDVFRNLVYNRKYNLFIIEFDINPRYNYGTVYYVIFNTEGQIWHVGASSTWGGSGPDGESFLTENDEYYVTCMELYNFKGMTSVSISDYTLSADVLNNLGPENISYNQVHAIRNLSGNIFLVVFNLENKKPEYNAVLLSTDSIILDRFSYKGIMEDMDAVFLYHTDSLLKQHFIHDMEREVLIYIDIQDSVHLRQIAESEMLKLSEDSLLSEGFIPINFESFGSKTFYVLPQDSLVFYRGGTID